MRVCDIGRRLLTKKSKPRDRRKQYLEGSIKVREKKNFLITVEPAMTVDVFEEARQRTTVRLG